MPRCKLPNCPVASDGRCLEGLGAQCPNLIPYDAEEASAKIVTDAASVDRSIPPYRPTQKLYSGLPLEIADARQFTRRGKAVVVVLVGTKECGKTSLIARLHQDFQAAPLGDYDFAGSRTLLRFEEMNWLATLESGASKPAMERSSQQFDNSLLHLTVRQRYQGAERIDVLLNDISGETFGEVIKSDVTCERLAVLRRADHLAVLVDGEALANPKQRFDQIAKVRNFLQRVSQIGQIGKTTCLHIVTTKQDFLLADERRAGMLPLLAKLESDVEKLVSSKIGILRFWHLAARPFDGSMPTSGTIQKLFTTWITETSSNSGSAPEHANPVPYARDFSRFGR